jgi:site-specific recombinase XerD
MMERFLLELELHGVAPSTLRLYRSVLQHFEACLHTHGATLESATPDTVMECFAARKRAGIKPTTLRTQGKILREYFKWAGKPEHARAIILPRAKRTVLPALTPSEVDAILRATGGRTWQRKRDYALVLLLLSTGLRIHEAHKLTVADASQDALLITGKGSKQRWVFLSDDVRRALRKYLDAMQRATGRTLDADAPLWWTANAPMSLACMRAQIRAIGRRAGLPKHLGAHAFRRTFATWSLRNGIDMEHLRQLMGHSDYTVLRQYLALDARDLQRAHEQHNPLQNLRKRKR